MGVLASSIESCRTGNCGAGVPCRLRAASIVRLAGVPLREVEPGRLDIEGRRGEPVLTRVPELVPSRGVASGSSPGAPVEAPGVIVEDRDRTGVVELSDAEGVSRRRAWSWWRLDPGSPGCESPRRRCCWCEPRTTSVAPSDLASSGETRTCVNKTTWSAARSRITRSCLVHDSRERRREPCHRETVRPRQASSAETSC